jgi:hypothetical protein
MNTDRSLVTTTDLPREGVTSIVRHSKQKELPWKSELRIWPMEQGLQWTSCNLSNFSADFENPFMPYK